MSNAHLDLSGDTLSIHGELDFDTVVALVEPGEQWLTRQPEGRIDLAGVRFSNSAGVVLLLAWQRAAQQPLRLENVPPSLISMIKLGGLKDIFQCL